MNQDTLSEIARTGQSSTGSIDYTLFLLTRYREELARQGATPEAIRTTLRTAGTPSQAV